MSTIVHIYLGVNILHLSAIYCYKYLPTVSLIRLRQDPKDALLREYAEEIARLKAMLEGKIPMSVDAVASQQSVVKEVEYVVKESDESERLKLEYEEKIAEMNVSLSHQISVPSCA